MRKGPQCRAEETPKTLHSKSCKGQRSFSDRSSALLQWAVLTLLPAQCLREARAWPQENQLPLSAPHQPPGVGGQNDKQELSLAIRFSG